MPVKPAKRDKAKELFWRKAIARQAVSGLTQSEFCRREGLNANNFSGWKTEIAQRDAESSASDLSAEPEPVFVAVSAVARTEPSIKSPNPIAEIDLTAGVVRIFAGVDRHSLHEIIAALREVAY